jgi:hypothetical protein
MVMYFCARDIDVSSFYTLSIDQARRENGNLFVCRKDVEGGNIDISSTQMNDYSLSWLCQ